MKGAFRQAVQGERLAISAELSLTRDSGADHIAEQAQLFRDRVDGVQVADNPLAWVHLSTPAASALLMQNDIDPIPILTCRDRNRIGLMSDLLGLRALGVTSTMLWRGRRVGKKHALHASTVFDMTGRELIAMAAGLNEEESIPGDPLFIGAGARVHRPRKGLAFESLTVRAEAGAQFLQTQLCYNLESLGEWLNALVDARLTWRYSIIITLTPFPSAKTARWMKDNMQDARIPESIIERLEGASDPEEEGVQICAETMRAVAKLPAVSGVNLISTGDPGLLARAIDASGLRRGDEESV